jgi:hypothetical protein
MIPTPTWVLGPSARLFVLCLETRGKLRVPQPAAVQRPTCARPPPEDEAAMGTPPEQSRAHAPTPVFDLRFELRLFVFIHIMGQKNKPVVFIDMMGSPGAEIVLCLFSTT